METAVRPIDIPALREVADDGQGTDIVVVTSRWLRAALGEAEVDVERLPVPRQLLRILLASIDPDPRPLETVA